MKNIFLATCLALMLTACVSSAIPAIGKVDNKTAQTTIFQAQSYYNAAVVVETAYDKLPACPTAKPLCSDADLKKKVRSVDDAAWLAITQAQKAVRTPGFGDDKLTTYLTSASALVKAFTDITATLPANQ